MKYDNYIYLTTKNKWNNILTWDHSKFVPQKLQLLKKFKTTSITSL
jgi:hypothetical protein